MLFNITRTHPVFAILSGGKIFLFLVVLLDLRFSVIMLVDLELLSSIQLKITDTNIRSCVSEML